MMCAYFIAALLISFTSNAQASISYLVRNVDPLALRKAFPQLSLRPLFSSNENKALARLRHSALGSTQVLGSIDDSEAERFELKMRQLFPGARFERNLEVSLMPLADVDPLVKEQWALKNTGQPIRVDVDDLRTEPLNVLAGEDLHLPTKEQLGGLKEVTVAVLDTGTEITHPDLVEQLRWKKPECEALAAYLSCTTNDKLSEKECLAKVGNIDRDDNGYPMDCVGWNVVNQLSTEKDSPLSAVMGSPDMNDELGHGTHVAGIIGAQSHNKLGVQGVAPNVKLLPVRVISTAPTSPLRPQSIDSDIPKPTERTLKKGTSAVDIIARGLLYAITERVQIINMSLGWPATINSSFLEEMIQLAQEQGIAVIAAAGNDSTDTLVLPCSYSGVICVGAYGPDGKRSPFSNRGPGVDFLAPGTSILSTYPTALRARFFTDLQGYEFMSGTSQAAPMASATLAILLGKGLSVDESLARMMLGARTNGSALGENLRLDLNQSIAVTPRPYLRALERAPIRVNLTDAKTRIRGNYHLKNLWSDIRECSVRYTIKPLLNTLSESTLKKEIQVFSANDDCSNWGTKATRALSFDLEATALANRDLIVHAEFNYTDAGGHRYQQTVPVGVKLIPSIDFLMQALARNTFAIVGKPAGNRTGVRTLIAADAKVQKNLPEYLAISGIEKDLAFQVLSPQASGASTEYHYSASQKLTDLSWEFLVGQRYYSQEAKSSRIALIFRKKNELTLLTQFRFDIYDSEFKTRVRSVFYDGSYAPLPENFRWSTLNGKDAIVFVANGIEPPSGDVWQTTLDKNVQLRCYILDAEGKLKEVIVDPRDPEIRIVDFVAYHPDDTDAGDTSMLVVRGRDYQIQYAIGHLKNGVITSLDPFEINPYRFLGGLKSAPVLSETGPTSANVFSSTVGRGKMRGTILRRTDYNRIESHDFRFAPVTASEGVNRLVGGIEVSGRTSFFTQTNWNIQFHEVEANQQTVVKTSMNRFSFLPSIVTQRAFYPLLIKNEHARPEPALLTADTGSGFFNLSILIPERDDQLRVVGLRRPAVLSFEANESGCKFIENPFWDRSLHAYRMNSFCGDSIRSIVMQLPAANSLNR